MVYTVHTVRDMLLVHRAIGLTEASQSHVDELCRWRTHIVTSSPSNKLAQYLPHTH